MPRFVLLTFAALACSAAASPGRLNPSLLQQKARLLPASSSNHHAPLDYKLPKYTPGDACSSQKSCQACLVNQVCVWLPFGSACVEDRDPLHKTGTMQCGVWTPDLLPVVTNEHDDYKLFHTRNDPRDFNIATLNGGQDMYGLAVDLEGKTPNDPNTILASNGGGEIINGLSHKSFMGNSLEHTLKGRMLPIGVKGDETHATEGCDCTKTKFAAKGCDCGFEEYTV